MFLFLCQPQDKYNALSEGSDVPGTLSADLVRLVKLAKVGQQSIVDSISLCCNGSASTPFANYTSSLDNVVANAGVNVSSILAAVNGSNSNSGSSGTGSTTPPSQLAGRLMDNGGIKDCKVNLHSAVPTWRLLLHGGACFGNPFASFVQQGHLAAIDSRCMP